MSRAVLWLDHHRASVLQFDETHTERNAVKDHPHDTGQHHSAVRTQHEFFASVCEALEGLEEVLVTAAQTAQSDFRHYVTKHRHALLARLVGWETVDHPTDGELVAMARKFFLAHDRLKGAHQTL
jgi:hypothetical protein